MRVRVGEVSYKTQLCAGHKVNKSVPFFQPAARNQLARSIGQELRRGQQKRVQTQQSPDGSKFAPRKRRDLCGKHSRIRRRLRCSKSCVPRLIMKARGDSNAVAVGFTGRSPASPGFTSTV
ncbi:phage virion morphogenesis protein [Pseudomonas paralactis]|uniref:phage virion morphogenesis protein n=1 Tax=Pseudomonas paralactis TaxID=1615673 RepID=UPI00313FF9EB